MPPNFWSPVNINIIDLEEYLPTTIKGALTKNFCHAKRILAVKEVGLSESIKEGKFVTKIFFSYNVEWSWKWVKWKMMSADMKADIKQQ